MKRLSSHFLKFRVVGITAFCIDYGTMLLLTEIFGMDYMISTTVGFIVALVFNYLASMRFVFARRSDISRKREFIVFAILSIIGLLLNDALMFLGASIIDIDYRVTKIIVTAIVSVYNFVSRKAFLEEKDESPLSALE